MNGVEDKPNKGDEDKPSKGDSARKKPRIPVRAGAILAQRPENALPAPRPSPSRRLPAFATVRRVHVSPPSPLQILPCLRTAPSPWRLAVPRGAGREA